MTDNVPQHNLPPPGIALHLLCDAVDPFTNHPQLYTSAACQHLPGALTRPARNEKLSLLASTQQVHGPLGQLLGNATDLVVWESNKHRGLTERRPATNAACERRWQKLTCDLQPDRFSILKTKLGRSTSIMRGICSMQMSSCTIPKKTACRAKAQIFHLAVSLFR